MAVEIPKAPWYAGGGGVTTVSRQEAQSFARSITGSSIYRANLQDRAEKGILPPAVEIMLWHFAYGKPIEQVQVTVSDDLSSLTPEQLAQKAQFALAALEKVKELEAMAEAIDVNATKVA